MRALLAIVILVGGMLALSASADAGRKGKRIAKPSYYYAERPRRFQANRSGHARQACAYDRGGYFRGFPCWGRKAFSEGTK